MATFRKSDKGIEVKGWNDSKGREWNIMIATTNINGRKEPVEMHIYSSNESVRLTQSTIREVPFKDFFQDKRIYLQTGSILLFEDL